MFNMKLRISQIELTSRCNATCSYCPHGTLTRKKEDMTKEIFEQTLKIIDKEHLWKIANNYVVELHSFGEAFLLGDKLFYFLDRMKEEGLTWNLSTNGILLGKNKNFDRRLMSYEGVLEISLENLNPKITIDEKYIKVNEYLKMHSDVNSQLINILIDYGNVDFSRITGCAGISKYNLHTWGENDKPHSTCKFLNENFFTIHSNGNIVSCCMDANGETNFGTVFNPSFEKNKRWRKCDTCEGGLL